MFNNKIVYERREKRAWVFAWRFLLMLNLRTYETWNSIEVRKKMLPMNLHTYRTWNSIEAREKKVLLMNLCAYRTRNYIKMREKNCCQWTLCLQNSELHRGKKEKSRCHWTFTLIKPGTPQRWKKRRNFDCWTFLSMQCRNFTWGKDTKSVGSKPFKGAKWEKGQSLWQREERKASLLHTLKGVVTLNLWVATAQQLGTIFGLCRMEVLNPIWCLVGMRCNFFMLCWALRIKFCKHKLLSPCSANLKKNSNHWYDIVVTM
jgi:hypothetical protein